MIVKISPHKFELRSRHTGRVLGTHPSRARALAQERAIKASQARAARGIRRNPAKGFHELQDAWRRADAAQSEFKHSLDFKYQRASWASKGEITKLDKLKRATDRASDAFYKWLEKNSPWDFTSGVNIAWLRDKLTEQQALSAEPPTLPAAATSYGYEAKEFHPMRRRNPSAYAREPGETATQQAVRNYTIPVIIGVGLLGVLWYVNRTPAQSAYVLQTRPIPFEMSDAQKNTVLQITQAQLKSLGYNITRIDGISGPETQAAVTAFVNANLQAVQAVAQRYGQDERATLYAIDDAYRAHFGLPTAT